MALQSMTGFGKGEAIGDNYQVTTEIKSVNHRFKDLRFKMSSVFNSIEMSLKEELLSHFKRGSFDIYINFKKADSRSRFEDLDVSKIQDFYSFFEKNLPGKDIQINPTDLLRSEFYQDRDISKDQDLLDLVRQSFTQALMALKKSREEEGAKLLLVLEDHRQDYINNFKIIDDSADTFQKSVEERLRKKFDEILADSKIDEPRFLQEVVYYLEKMDIGEEINRIKIHLEKLDDLLKGDGERGRQIDFLIQELNRETNTTGSKSSIEDISAAVIKMKVALEKIREQGLNIE